VTARLIGTLRGALAGGRQGALSAATGGISDRANNPESIGSDAVDRATEPDSVAARRYNNAGEWFYRQRSLRSARDLFNSALRLYDRDTSGVGIPRARALGNLGLTLLALGRFAEADSVLSRAAELSARHMGDDAEATLAARNNLAVAAQRRGDFPRAERAISAAAEGLAKADRPEARAIALNNRAMLRYAIGQADEAAKLLAEAFELANQAAPRGVLPIQILGNRALVAQAQGQYDAADGFYATALERQERRLSGRNHPDIARLLGGRAALYLQMGKTNQVEPLLQQALSITRAKFGDAHPSTAALQHNLGAFYRVTGRLDEATAQLSAARATREATLGTNHPDYLDTDEALALTAWQAGRTAEATPTLRRLQTAWLTNAQRFFAAMSEPEKARYWATLRPRLERFTNYAVANAAADPSLAADAYNQQLATKAMLLSSSTQLRERILSGKDPKLVALYQQWQRVSEQLAHAYTLSRADQTEAGLRPDSLEGVRSGLEKRLSAASAEFAGALSAAPPTWEKVAAALAPGEAAVELVRVRTYDARFTGGVTYAALVVTAGGRPTVVSTTTGAELEGRALARYRRAIRSKSADTDSYGAYWAWLAPALANVKTAFVAPDGVYNQISLPTLRAPEGRYVLDQLALRTLVSTRDLPGVKAPKANAAKTATLVGAADFGVIGTSASGSTERAVEKTIEPLPGTLTEVTQIQALLRTAGWAPSLLTAANASELKVKGVAAPRLLHVATHGFFLPDVGESGTLVFGVQPERAAENPLLRSGLLLAGAERAVQQIDGVAPQPGDNGVLTAFEALTLNLRGTDLVVLSACETGLGEVQAGEGVFGLQRAIQLAGARALVFSLWRVDDAASQQLMTSFYKYWLAGRPLAAAFQQAQRDLMLKYPDPYYWGAFVLIGA